MPALKNSKWELCALAMAGGSTQREAYRAGGLKFDGSSASKLFNRPEMKTRVAEIIAERDRTERQIAQRAVAEAAIDRAWVIRNLRHNALAAMRGHPLYSTKGEPLKDSNGHVRYGKPDHQAAATSLRLIGLDIGMFINRTEVGGPGDFARMSDTELQEELRRLAEAIGAPPEMLRLLEPEAEEED